MWRIGALAFGFVFAPILAVAAECVSPVDLHDGWVIALRPECWPRRHEAMCAGGEVR